MAYFPPNMKEIAEKMFDEADTNKSNYIEFNELKDLLTLVTKEIDCDAPSDNDVKEVFKDCDISKDQKISRDEFVKMAKIIYEMKHPEPDENDN